MLLFFKADSSSLATPITLKMYIRIPLNPFMHGLDEKTIIPSLVMPTMSVGLTGDDSFYSAFIYFTSLRE